MRYIRLYEESIYKRYVIVSIRNQINLLRVLETYNLHDNSNAEYMQCIAIFIYSNGKLRDMRSDITKVRVPTKGMVIMGEFDELGDAIEEYMLLVDAKKYNL
jgi:hypothetical protein